MVALRLGSQVQTNVNLKLGYLISGLCMTV